MRYTLAQARALLEADARIERQHLALRLALHAVAAQGDRAAIERLAHALDATVLLGLPTNRAFLAACLRHPVFRAGEARIPFLTEYAEALRAAATPSREALAAAVLAASLGGRPAAAALPVPFARPLRWRVVGRTLDVLMQECGGGAAALTLDGQRYHAQLTGDALSLDGCRRPLWLAPLDARRWAVQWGADALELENCSHDPPARIEAPDAARELRAGFNGRVVAVRVAAGDVVDAGQTLLTLESMKIEHQISAPQRAHIARVAVVPGQQVQPGQILIIFSGRPA